MTFTKLEGTTSTMSRPSYSASPRTLFFIPGIHHVAGEHPDGPGEGVRSYLLARFGLPQATAMVPRVSLTCKITSTAGSSVTTAPSLPISQPSHPPRYPSAGHRGLRRLSRFSRPGSPRTPSSRFLTLTVSLSCRWMHTAWG